MLILAHIIKNIITLIIREVAIEIFSTFRAFNLHNRNLIVIAHYFNKQSRLTHGSFNLFLAIRTFKNDLNDPCISHIKNLQREKVYFLASGHAPLQMTDNRARAILRIDGFTRRLPPFTSEGPKALPHRGSAC